MRFCWRGSLTPDLHTGSRLTKQTNKNFGTGSATQAIFSPIPQRTQREVHYETTVPTVLDRFLQQAVMQVLQQRWDPEFSDHSYGFRPGRSAHQAVAQAQQYIAEDRGWGVDLGLDKFFEIGRASCRERV